MDLDKKTLAEAMGGHTPPAPHPPIPPGTVAYEQTDVHAGSVVRVATVLIVISIAAAAAAFILFRMLGTREARQDPPPPPLARAEEGRLPPAPRLQTAPASELAALREEERLALTGYGWADEKAGVARIPIEEAMGLYVAGMRAPAASPAPAAPAPSAAPAPASPVHR
jgi:hypothetical protein